MTALPPSPPSSPWRSSRVSLAAAAIFALAGMWLVGDALYIHAKAMLAQVLLERAFAASIATGAAVKPWSWADTWPVARIEVPRLGARAIVLAVGSGQALAFGPGHASARPTPARTAPPSTRPIATPISPFSRTSAPAMRS